MVGSVSSQSSWTNYSITNSENALSQVGEAASASKTTATAAVDSLVNEAVIEKAPDAVLGNSGVVIPQKSSSGAKEAVTGDDYEVIINTESPEGVEEQPVPSKLADLKKWDKFTALAKSEQSLVLSVVTAGKGKAEVVTALANLITNQDFIESSDTTRTTLLSQCKFYANASVIDNLGQLAGVDWFKEMSPEDMQRAAKSIAYVTKHGQSKVGSEQNTIISNTVDRLLSGEIKMDFHEFDDDPGTITYGHSHSWEKRISINSALVPAGDSKFPENKTDSRHAVLATLAHEVSHSVNGDKNQATYEYFQAEYRAWFVGYIAEYGKHPNRQEAFDRCIELFELYPNIDAARTDTSWFGLTTSGDARKIIAFMDQFDSSVELNVKDTDSADAIFDLEVTKPKETAPLPDTSINYDFDN